MRHGAGPDGVRAYGSGRRACYGSGRRATRCGPGRRANGRTAFDMRCGYDRRVRTVWVGTTCERDGAGAAGVAAENYDVNRHGYGSMILWWRTTTTAPPRIILVPIASDGLSVRRLVVYELVYRTEPTDGAVVKMQLHYTYSQWWSFVRRFLLLFDGWLMDSVILEAKYIYSIYIYIYVPWVPWDVKTGFPPAARIRRVCEYARALVSLRSEVDHEELL